MGCGPRHGQRDQACVPTTLSQITTVGFTNPQKDGCHACLNRSHDLDQVKIAHIYVDALCRGRLMNKDVGARDRIAVVPLRGEVCSPLAHLVYTQTISLITAYAPRHLILDLRAVTRLDEAGLGELVRIHAFAGQHDCVCELAAVPRDVQQLLLTAGHDDTFRAAASAESA